MEDRESFVFYETFIESVECLPSDRQNDFIRAIINYGLFGIEPEYEGAEKGMWLCIKNGIDDCKERRKTAKEKGSKGGKSKKLSTAQAVLNPRLSTAQAEKNGLSTAQAEKEPLNLNGNVNVNVDVNGKVNVNEGVKPTDTDTDLSSTLTSDSVHDYLQELGYDCSHTACGQVASILNKNGFDLDFIKYMENVVSDKYSDISPSLMVNALTTWTDRYDGYSELRQTKKKRIEKAPLEFCVGCGEKLNENNWINGHYHVYFCTGCMQNYVRRKNNEWERSDVLTA